MAELKNQHFVPRCLLKPFSFKGEGRWIELYNIRHDKLIERAAVKGQCARNYLYGKEESPGCIPATFVPVYFLTSFTRFPCASSHIN